MGSEMCIRDRLNVGIGVRFFKERLKSTVAAGLANLWVGSRRKNAVGSSDSINVQIVFFLVRLGLIRNRLLDETVLFLILLAPRDRLRTI